MIMRAAKVDNNHAQIVKELRDMGYSVKSIAQLKNCCDLIVSNGRTVALFEVKSPEYCRGIEGMTQHERERFLTDGEKRFAEDFTVHIVISADEIDNIMGGM